MISGGADVGNPLGQAGFKGHPMCKFCIMHFFDDGQLYVHMQREHFQCFLCQRIAPDSTNPVYYKNYPELEQHFKREHSMCDHPACLEKKFVAFASPMELQRHMALEHKGELSKDARKQALRANDLLGFVTPSGTGMQPAMPMIQRGRGTRSGVASAAVTQLGISAEQLARFRAQARAEAASAEAAARARATLIDDSAPTPAESYGNGSSIPRSASGNDMAASAGPSLSTAARWSAAATVGRIVPTDDVNSFPSLQRSSSSSAVQTQQTGAMSGAPRSLAQRIGGEGHGAPGVRNVARMPPAAAPQAAMPSLFGAASSSSGGASFVSSDESVRAANAALSRRIQNMLPLVTRDEDFARMRQLSARFRDGQLSGSQYYASLQSMGLAPCVPELAALLPDAGKRRELMEVAASASASVPAARVGATAASIAAHAQLRAGGVRVLTPAWTCGACTLNNAAGTDTCSACGGRRRPSEGEGVSALAVALEAAMRTGKGRGKKYGGGAQMSGGAPVPVADFPQPTRAPTPQSVPAASHESLASAFPALPSAAPSSGAAPLGARRKRSVGVSPGNQWTQGRPM
jgi:E3 ubiquitin-protein ligase ZNF598